MRKAIGESGVVGVMLDVMKAHIDNTSVCENGCGALYNITYHNG